MNQLYLECYSGISGDMFVASLLDLGASKEVLEEVLSSLPLAGFKTEITRVNKSGLDVCDFNVILDHDNHDHDMNYLYGEHTHHEHHHHHEHRHLHDILHIIDHAQMTDHAKELAKKIFTILGEAEAKAHGTTIEEVHFHEVGAVDSIVDIISAAVCFDDLGIDEVYIPVIYEGTGTVHCAHGTLPIPVPAVNNIVSSHHLPLHIDTIKGELVTPTGAAIAASIVTSHTLPSTFTIKKTGIGAGKRAYERPSLLRAMLIETDPRTNKVCKLETNIDDSTGEVLGHVMELLMSHGAKDVHYIPVMMKKNRPAYLLNVLCDEEKRKELETIIFKETSTIGIRRTYMERTVLQRTFETISTPLGDAIFKVVNIEGNIRAYPEYESAKLLSEKHNLSIIDVYQLLERSYYEFSRHH